MLSVVGLLQDEVDPMVSVMKVEKASLESYADIRGLDSQIQEIKEAVGFMRTLVSSLLRVLSFTGNLGLERHCLQR